MRVLANKEKLVKALSHAVSVVGKATATNAQYATIAVSESGIGISVSNLDQSLYEIIDHVERITDGVVSVPAEMVLSVVKKAPKNCTVFMTLTDTGNCLKISYDKAEFEIPTVDVNTVPRVEPPKGNEGAEGDSFRVVVKSEVLEGLMRYTRFSMPTVKYLTTGMFFHVEDGKLTLASSDNGRLSVAATVGFVDSLAPSVGSFMIDRKTADEVMGIIKDTKEVCIRFCGNIVEFCVDGVVSVRSKVLEGTFPQYRKAIPEKSTLVELKGAREGFINLVDRAAVLCSKGKNDNSREVMLELADGKELACCARDGKMGWGGKDSMSVECGVEGAKWKAAFNADYLLDVFNAVSDEEVKVYVKDGTSGIVITAKGGLFVVMPRRVRV